MIDLIKWLPMCLFRKERWGKFLTVLCSLAISVVVAEVMLRFASAGYLSMPTDAHPVLHHTQPSNFEFTSFDPGPGFDGVMQFDNLVMSAF